MKRLYFLLLAALCAGKVQAQDKPNVMLIIADDLAYNDIEPYGSKQVHTPNLSRLAQQGVCFDNMYTSTAMCSPTRQQLLTGLYPVRNGAYPNHSHVNTGTKSVAHYMQSLGYNTAIIGKRDFGPDESFPFTFLGGKNMDYGKGRDIELEKAEAYINSSKKPYFLVVASNQPHVPWNRGNPAMYPPGEIKVPEWMVNTPLTRKGLSKYFAEVTYLDSLVGVCLDIVKRSGKEENTVIIFTSEHGSQFPFAKWTCYDEGLKTGFIVKWPGHTQAGTRNPAFTQYVDVVPTLVDIAGADPASFNTGNKDAYGNSKFDGMSFKNVILGKANGFRDYVFGVQTTNGIIKGSDSYPVRSVRNNRYLYIRNLNNKEQFSNVATAAPMYQSWLKTGNEADFRRAKAYTNRPAEELYDCVKDPFQLVNLADKSEFNAVKQQLRTQLDKFMAQQGDKGVETEKRAPEHRAGQGEGD
ncbi:sulfatase [Pedobacter sp. BS3]|uniref:sulfatase family protein n=1 Tax=Pedobacter sp. BS3 TaxID=2567937 RepID=UPI001659F2CA|nr:sulfatase [Pedobacter sp. BS3]